MTRMININLISTLIFFTLLNLSCDNNRQGFDFVEDDDPYSYLLNINFDIIPGECESGDCSYDNQIDYSDLNYSEQTEIELLLKQTLDSQTYSPSSEKEVLISWSTENEGNCSLCDTPEIKNSAGISIGNGGSEFTDETG